MNLTGISQEKVDRQKTFVDVFDHFQDWIEQIQYEFDLRFATQSRNLSTKYGPNVTFCSWSNYDLQFFLKKECQRNDIRIPPHLKAWINVQRIYDVRVMATLITIVLIAMKNFPCFNLCRFFFRKNI